MVWADEVPFTRWEGRGITPLSTIYLFVVKTAPLGDLAMSELHVDLTADSAILCSYGVLSFAFRALKFSSKAKFRFLRNSVFAYKSVCPS